MGRKPRIPGHLSPESKAIWADIEANWDLDGHSRTILQVSLEAFDQMRTAQELVSKVGLVFKTKSGQIKLNPAVQAVKVARSQFLHSWKMLNLGGEPPEGGK